MHLISDPQLVFVADLIDSDLRIWKEDVIVNTFETEDAERILRIPLAQLPDDDS